MPLAHRAPSNRTKSDYVIGRALFVNAAVYAPLRTYIAAGLAVKGAPCSSPVQRRQARALRRLANEDASRGVALSLVIGDKH